MTDLATPKPVETHRVVSQAKWVAARKKLLDKEKALTRLGDKLSAERRALPWVKIDKQYLFDTPEGRKTAPRPLRRSQPTYCPPSHAPSRLGGGVPGLLLPSRPRRRSAAAPRTS